MLPTEVLRQVRRIEITTSRLVNELMAGRYESTFKGRGIEFDEVREYQAGDEIRLIDWNVTARTGRPHVKRFIEERELTIMVLVDLSRSMAFGSVGSMKQRLAAELCAVLAFSAIRNHDLVGAMLCTDRIERFIPPEKGSRHVLRLVRDVLSFEPSGHGTDLVGALHDLGRMIRRRSVVFLISDFFTPDLRVPLAVANRRHDVIAVHLIDPRESTWPAVGRVRVEDAETGRAEVIPTGRAAARDAVGAWARDHQARVETMCRSAGVDVMPIRTDQSYIDPLLRFFNVRAARR